MTATSSHPTLVEPVFEYLPGIRAGFSRKAAHLHNPNGRIPGLNTGYHTQASEADVYESRLRIYQEMGVVESQVAWLRQIHSTTVHHVTEGGEAGEADALVTRTPDVTLAIQVADCAALLCVDPIAGVIGAAHAGWRGAVGGVVLNTLEQMVSLGADSQNVHAWVSPCIGQARYEVGPEVGSRFPETLKQKGDGDRWMVDLKGLVRKQMLDFGLYESNLDLHPGCTYRDASNWYSYRREGERAGRMMALVMLEDGRPGL